MCVCVFVFVCARRYSKCVHSHDDPPAGRGGRHMYERDKKGLWDCERKKESARRINVTACKDTRLSSFFSCVRAGTTLGIASLSFSGGTRYNLLWPLL